MDSDEDMGRGGWDRGEEFDDDLLMDEGVEYYNVEEDGEEQTTETGEPKTSSKSFKVLKGGFGGEKPLQIIVHKEFKRTFKKAELAMDLGYESASLAIEIPVANNTAFLENIILIGSSEADLDDVDAVKDVDVEQTINILLATQNDVIFKIPIFISRANNFLRLENIIVFESESADMELDTRQQRVLLDLALIENETILLKLFRNPSSASTTLIKMAAPWIDNDQDISGELEKFLELTPPAAPAQALFYSLASTISSTPSKLLSSFTRGGGGSESNTTSNVGRDAIVLAFDHVGAGSHLLKSVTVPFFPSLVFTLASDCKVRCWDLLSSQIVATLDLGGSASSNPEYAKRVKSGGGFMKVIHVGASEPIPTTAVVHVLFYSPVFLGFSLVQLELDLSQTRISYKFKAVENIGCPKATLAAPLGRLVDVCVSSLSPISDERDEEMVEGATEFRVWVLWQEAIKYIDLSVSNTTKDTESVPIVSRMYEWKACLLPRLIHPSTPHPIQACLSHLANPHFPVSVLQKALESGSERRRDLKAGMGGIDETGGYRLLHAIDAGWRDANLVCGIDCFDAFPLIYKNGGVGVVRAADAVENPGALSVSFLENVCGIVVGERGVVTPEVLEGLEKELVFGSDGCLDVGLDEYTAHVYDTVLAAIDPSLVWNSLRVQVVCILQQMGGKIQVEAALDRIVTSFQHPDYQDFDEEGQMGQVNDFFLSLIVNSAVSIIQKRRETVRALFFTTCLLRHIAPEYAPSRQLFMRLQSLVCCYWRLDWLSLQTVQLSDIESGFGGADQAQEDKSLIDYIVSTSVKFNPDEFLLSPTLAVTTAVHTVFSFLGMSRAHALTSLKEAAPIVTFLNKYFDLIPPASILDFLRSLPLATPAACFLKAKAWLYLDEFQKARHFFEKAIGNDGGETDLQIVIQTDSHTPLDDSVNTASNYYVFIANLCLERNVLDLVIYFGKLAISTAKSHDTLPIIKMVFNSAISCADFKTAYECVITLPDPSIQRDCLQLLISELCDARELDLLCGGFSFAGMQWEVEKSLHFKARNEPASPYHASVFRDITYSYFIYCGDFRNAAVVMFLHAVKLFSIVWSDKYGNHEIQSVYIRMSQCLLAALNALSLLEPIDAYIKCPQPVLIYQNGTLVNSHIVKTDDIRRMYQLALAKLVLHPQYPYLQNSFKLPNPQDIFSTYCGLYDTEAALIVAALFEFDLLKVILSCCEVIIRQTNHLPCIVPEQEEFTNVQLSPLARAWETLKRLLAHDSASNGWKYHVDAINSILTRLPEFKLPQWLLDTLQDDGELLIRIYLKHNRVEDALSVALNTLTNVRKPLSSNYGNCSRWIPVTILEQLLLVLKQVDGKGYQSLQIAIADYQPSTGRF